MNIVLTWPNIPGTQLQSSSSVANNAMWTPVLDVPQLSHDEWSVAIVPRGASRFYRLASANPALEIRLVEGNNVVGTWPGSTLVLR